MRRYLRLWLALARLSWRRVPGLVVALCLVQAVAVVLVATTALALSAAVDGMVRGDTGAAVVGASLAALSFTASLIGDDLFHGLRVLAVERVGLTDLHEQIFRDIGTIEGLAHLERPEFLDRVTVVESSGWTIMAGMWGVVAVGFNLLQLAVLVLLLGTVSPWLGLLLVAAAVPLWFDHFGNRRINAVEIATAEVWRRQRQLFDLAVDPASGKEIRVAGAGPDLVLQQEAAYRQAAARRAQARSRAVLWRLTGWGLFTVAFLAGITLVAHLVVTSTGTPGDIVLALSVSVNLRQAVQATVDRATEAAAAGRVVQPYLWLRDYAVADRARTAASTPVPDRLRRGLTISGVTFRYPGRDRPALDDVSVHLLAGSVVAIVGEYGSGKTTLVKLICKLYKPDAGTILVDGIDLADLDTAQWRARSCAVFQDFGRFDTTFVETVGIGDLARIDDRDRVGVAVRAGRADDVVAKLPDGLDTQLGRRLGGVDLSEGQWQRTALSRAAMRAEPLLVVLDEPSASLDAPSEQEILEGHLRRARALADTTGAITVVVSHRFSTVNGADLILVLDRGRIVESGSHHELMSRGGRYADLYGIQATGYRLV